VRVGAGALNSAAMYALARQAEVEAVLDVLLALRREGDAVA
jgi:hypothetical protein